VQLVVAREMTRVAKFWMLSRSMGEMSCPMDALAASRMSRAFSSSPVTSSSSARQWKVAGEGFL